MPKQGITCSIFPVSCAPSCVARINCAYGEIIMSTFAYDYIIHISGKARLSNFFPHPQKQFQGDDIFNVNK